MNGPPRVTTTLDGGDDLFSNPVDSGSADTGVNPIRREKRRARARRHETDNATPRSGLLRRCNRLSYFVTGPHRHTCITLAS
jgi:hypothetical protein